MWGLIVVCYIALINQILFVFSVDSKILQYARKYGKDTMLKYYPVRLGEWRWAAEGGVWGFSLRPEERDEPAKHKMCAAFP